MRYLLLLSVLLTGCTVYHGGVKEVDLAIDSTAKTGTLVVQKCDLKVYLALYGLVAAEENCRTDNRTVAVR